MYKRVLLVSTNLAINFLLSHPLLDVISSHYSKTKFQPDSRIEKGKSLFWLLLQLRICQKSWCKLYSNYNVWSKMIGWR